MPTFGENIRRIRENAEKSMSDAAKCMGVSLVHYSDMERGRRQPPFGDKLRKLAHFLDLNPGELEALAHKERKRVELDIENKPASAIEAALLLAKMWEDITEDQAHKILQALQ